MKLDIVLNIRKCNNIDIFVGVGILNSQYYRQNDIFFLYIFSQLSILLYPLLVCLCVLICNGSYFVLSPLFGSVLMMCPILSIFYMVVCVSSIVYRFLYLYYFHYCRHQYLLLPFILRLLFSQLT